MIFVDTGPLLARYLASDSNHQVALRHFAKLMSRPMFTSNHVLDETWTLLARRAGYGFAAERAQNLYASEAIQVLYGTREDDMAALELFRKFADQSVSFTDCLSFVLMKRARIRTAFTFDRHFAHAGFSTLG